MYRADTSGRHITSAVDSAGRTVTCWRSRSSGCSTRARCTGTSSASGWPACSGHSGRSPTARSTRRCGGLSEAGWITEEAPLDVAGAACRSRRGKRVYRLTAEGKEHLAELLAEVGPDAFDDEGFGARLAFFAQTRSDIRLQILEGRRRRVEEQRDGMRSTSPAGRAPRPLHPAAARARPGVGRPRGPLAHRTDRARTTDASEQTEHRARQQVITRIAHNRSNRKEEP